MTGTDDWIRLIGAPERPPEPTDWNRVRSLLGTDLPSDYRVLVETYPALALEQFLRITHPTGKHDHSNWTHVAPAVLDRLRETRRNGNIKFPHGLYPETPGLLPWGNTVNGDHCFWLADGEPDRWTIVITDLVDWWEFGGGLFDFVSGFVSGAVTCPVFPDDVPNGKPPYQEP
ncbi:hypothetical protein SK571_28175 [Lentzea sp. BCCO 10_0798]|uniref:SMI1-KNR4 cell-wall n=1 Tax=Lentzea kristufekii TaxID=3095430 RepID=A0ABU4TY76_9PSEU|nr:hypothetical protein [Lentzea sp. BCCO 10_0798]MDX8053269.1 hypothetical protein [Lentzea sp. BCCO 10_0798]